MKIMPEDHPVALQVKVLRSKINYHDNLSKVAPCPSMRSIAQRHADAFRIELAAVELKQQSRLRGRKVIDHRTHIPAMIMRNAGIAP